MAVLLSAKDLFSQGNASFVEENYIAAIELYNQAIELEDTCSEFYANRGHAFLKQKQYKESKTDSDSALELGLKNGKVYFRKGLACYHLEEYEEARQSFVASQEFSDVDKSTKDWISKCDLKLKEQIPKPVPVAIPSSKIKHEWYQTEPDIIVVILLKNAKPENVKFNFTENMMKCHVVRGGDADDYELELNLCHNVVPSQCSTKILPSKLEIKMRKAEGIHWTALEARAADAGIKHFVPSNNAVPPAQNVPPTYPSSSTKKRDWDKIAVDLKKDEESENMEGEAAVNHLFQKIYADGSDEVKKAMNKSFTESGGTVLSTNWKDIGKKKVDVKPPDGMEWKSWEI